MSLSELIAGVEDHRKTLTVVNASPGVADSLRDYFVDRNLHVAEETSEHTPKNYIVLGQDETFLTATSVATLLADEQVDPGFENASYRPVLDEMDETMFTSYDIGRMVAASREIEDRAWRNGKGQLHAGFQRLSTLETQFEVYSRLGSRGDLDVHAYAAPDVDVPETPGVRVHVEDTEEIRRSWFVVYDGGGVDENKCALLAEEREPREFYGFWTYGSDTVDYIIDHLTTSYAFAETDGGDGDGDGRERPTGRRGDRPLQPPQRLVSR
ncbi:Diguanylate Cyclase and Two-component system sensory domain-containing protein [Halogranum gelatinilyticum]|uniref:Diguanylate Cyclase and Two-component system sensory domain-containing protein n=1 Tax=Halogranum gelatinilyticum TaxID=660521 RepID=A0A1G9XI70_9EURY|nr:DICT sensory domain-containing protein [Halogranum gelatinilyticum]SDM96532.1 Diguanylate Cyclase and Two-component system sensory domain-containing protein [Halogranum gelatinilyticum]